MGHRYEILLPERDNKYFRQMAGLLPPAVFNASRGYTIVQPEPVTLRGTVPPNSTVRIFINEVDQFPTQTILADAEGAFSVLIVIRAGENRIRVQYFPTEIFERFGQSLEIHQALDVTFTVTLFTRYELDVRGSDIKSLLVNGTDLFLGGRPLNSSFFSLARYDLLTGAGTRLDASGDHVGTVFCMAADPSWLYVSQGTHILTRYALDLSAFTDLALSTSPKTLYADGTNLYSVREAAPFLKVAKINPGTFLVTGSELDLAAYTGTTYIADNAVDLVLRGAETTFSFFGDTIDDGTPGFGAQNAIVETSVYRKVAKAAMTSGATLTLHSARLDTSPTFKENSLIYAGGFYYTLIMGNPGKVLKLQDTGGADFSVVGAWPLPFSTLNAVVGPANLVQAKMVLGPDGKVYIAANGNFSKWTIDALSFKTIPTGEVMPGASSTHLAVVDVLDQTRALAADVTLFDTRGATSAVTAPAAPTGLVCQFDRTQSHFHLAWDYTPNSVIIEESKNNGPFSEATGPATGRQHVGNALVVSAYPFGVTTGDTMTYRALAYNAAGTSAPSATTSITLPFQTPAYADPTGLSAVATGASTIDLLWTDNETDALSKTVIYRSLDNMAFTEVGSVPNAGNSFTDTGLDPLTLYYYKVRVEFDDSFFSFNGRLPSAFSNTASDTTPEPVPPVPINVAAANAWEGISVTWTPGAGPGVPDDYKIYRRVGAGSFLLIDTIPAPASGYLDTTPVRATVNDYKVASSNTGGDSAQSTDSNDVTFYPQIVLTGITSGLYLASDATHVYINSTVDVTNDKIRVAKIQKSDSRVVSYFNVRNKVGTFITPQGVTMIGTDLFLGIKDQGENSRISKANTTTLTEDNSVLLDAAGGTTSFVTDGANYWAVLAVTGGSKIYRFLPTDLSLPQNVALGANVRNVQAALYFGGSIYIVYRSVSGAKPAISRVDASTLAVAETVEFGSGNPIGIAEDGTKLYALASDGKIYRFTTGPLALDATSGIISSSANVDAIEYASGGLFIYDTTAGVRKVDPAALTVSASKLNDALGNTGYIVLDGSYIYIAANGNRVGREEPATF